MLGALAGRRVLFVVGQVSYSTYLLHLTIIGLVYRYVHAHHPFGLAVPETVNGVVKRFHTTLQDVPDIAAMLLQQLVESKACPFCRAYERVHGRKAHESGPRKPSDPDASPGR